MGVGLSGGEVVVVVSLLLVFVGVVTVAGHTGRGDLRVLPRTLRVNLGLTRVCSAAPMAAPQLPRDAGRDWFWSRPVHRLWLARSYPGLERATSRLKQASDSHRREYQRDNISDCKIYFWIGQFRVILLSLVVWQEFSVMVCYTVLLILGADQNTDG